MRDFDDERHMDALDPSAREFTIGGEEYRARASVRPETLSAYNTLVDRISSSERVPDGEVLATLDDAICLMLEEPGAEQWRALRERDEDPLSVRMMWRVASFCVEAVSGRPLTSPSPDTGTPGESGTSSTLDSSSPALPELVPSI